MINNPQVGAKIIRLLITGAILAASSLASAQVTAFKVGELQSGMTKQCFYDGHGSQYTRTVGGNQSCPLSIQVQVPQPSMPAAPAAPRSGGLAFKSGEVVTGMTKQCFYNYLGSQITRTLSSVSICPLSIGVGN
jgi:hypothetical protein